MPEWVVSATICACCESTGTTYESLPIGDESFESASRNARFAWFQLRWAPDWSPPMAESRPALDDTTARSKLLAAVTTVTANPTDAGSR